ncbi:hypothetical protein [Gallibacterium anatis]|uniref:Uncharacterized protein n=1 Tax=Gallibacterium anatis 4895 TaxID=1396510 RepID=A0A0A2ZRT2_9PAST|nr:hypothetical protein [Gallibacterium anatis]KGQ59731.1 hypothetical protein IO48_10950 [Gallibacterium anatis 4895]
MEQEKRDIVADLTDALESVKPDNLSGDTPEQILGKLNHFIELCNIFPTTNIFVDCINKNHEIITYVEVVLEHLPRALINKFSFSPNDAIFEDIAETLENFRADYNMYISLPPYDFDDGFDPGTYTDDYIQVELEELSKQYEAGDDSYSEQKMYFAESSLDSDDEAQQGVTRFRLCDVFGDAFYDDYEPISFTPFDFNYIFNFTPDVVEQLTQNELETKLKLMFFDRFTHTIKIQRAAQRLKNTFFRELSGDSEPTLYRMQELIELKNQRSHVKYEIIEKIVSDWFDNEGLNSISSKRKDSIVKNLVYLVTNFDFEYNLRRLREEAQLAAEARTSEELGKLKGTGIKKAKSVLPEVDF